MNVFPLERFPDAMRTSRRLAVCFLPAIIVAFVITRDRFSGHDARHFHDLMQFEHAFYGGYALLLFTFATALFAVWQTAAPNLLTDEGGLGWLSIHGWEGELRQLPQRGLLPISEMMGMLVVTLAGEGLASTAIVFLPMCWSVVRFAPFWKTSAQDQPYTFGAVWMLHATATLCSGTRWLAIPVEIAAIVVSESLSVNAIHRKAEALLNQDVIFVTKQSVFVSATRPTRRPVRTPHCVTRSLFPFSQLGAMVDSEKPSWKQSIWIAIIIAWVMYCITTRTAEFGKWTNAAGNEFSIHESIGLAGMFAIICVSFMRMLVKFEPFVWRPRIGLIDRIRTFKPIVWSWDRVFLPYLFNSAILCIAATFRKSATSSVFAGMAFVQVLILLRYGLTPEEWQMTSDARLISPLRCSGPADNRAR